MLVWQEPIEEAVVGTEVEEHPDVPGSAVLGAAAVPSVRATHTLSSQHH